MLYSDSNSHYYTSPASPEFDTIFSLENNLSDSDWNEQIQAVQQQQQQQQQPNKRRHKRSMSDPAYNDEQQAAAAAAAAAAANGQACNHASNNSRFNLFGNYMPEDFISSILDENDNSNAVAQSSQKPTSQRQPRYDQLKAVQPPQSPSDMKKSSLSIPDNYMKAVAGSNMLRSLIDSDEEGNDEEEPSASRPYRAPAVAASSSTSGKIAINIVKHNDDQSFFNQDYTNHSNNKYSKQLSLQTNIRRTISRSVSPNNGAPLPPLSSKSSNSNQQEEFTSSTHLKHSPNVFHTNANTGSDHLQQLQMSMSTSIQQQQQQRQLLGNSSDLNNGSASTSQKLQRLENGNGKERYQGTLKFFDQDKNYGFIVIEDQLIDIFVHFEDLQKGGIPKTILLSKQQLRFEFGVSFYVGRHKESLKAVDIKILSDHPPYHPLNPQQIRALSEAVYNQSNSSSLTSPMPYSSKGRLHSPSGVSANNTTASSIPPGMLDQQMQHPGYAAYQQPYVNKNGPFLGVPQMSYHHMHMSIPNHQQLQHSPTNSLQVPMNMYGMQPNPQAAATAYMNQMPQQRQGNFQPFFPGVSSPLQPSQKGSSSYLPIQL